jgi:hypothetical protein
LLLGLRIHDILERQPLRWRQLRVGRVDYDSRLARLAIALRQLARDAPCQPSQERATAQLAACPRQDGVNVAITASAPDGDAVAPSFLLIVLAHSLVNGNNVRGLGLLLAFSTARRCPGDSLPVSSVTRAIA